MSKYEVWVERICAFTIGLSGLLVGLCASIWINHRYGSQEDVRSAQIAVTTALTVVGYIAGEFLARGVFYVINTPSPALDNEEIEG